MKKYIMAWVLMLCGTFVVAQNQYSAYIKDHDSGEALVGATLYFPQLQIGGTADENGLVSVSNIPNGDFTIEIRYLGYEEIKIKRSFPENSQKDPETFELGHHDEELEAVVVQSMRSTRVIEDIPSRVEVIAGEELAEKANMKPGDIRMLLSESTGIQTQQTSATSYNSSIRIQGLDGKYTQLLRDGLPLYGGYSGGLSLMQIAPLDLAQVEVIKGSSSTLYGGGAIAGLVNLISKRPEEERELKVMLNGTSALGLDASGFYAEDFGKVGTTVFVSYNKGTPYDPADIGLSAIPKFDRYSINPKLFWEISENSQLDFGINWTQEERLGGNMQYLKGESVANPYFEENLTDRLSTQLVFSKQLGNDKLLTVKNSLNHFNRKISIPDFVFQGDQRSSFSEANLFLPGEKSEWTAGFNLWTDKFTQHQGTENVSLDYNQTIAGVFVQNIWNASEEWTLESGFRLDHVSDEGLLALPRLSLMYEPNQQFTFRLGGGLGYKTPTVFSEDAEKIQFQNILPIPAGSLDSERSSGANFDVNYKIPIGEEVTLNANALFFYTHIQDPLLLVPSGIYYEYQQPDGSLQTQGVEVNLKWTYRDFKLFTGYTHAAVEQNMSGAKSDYPLVAKHRLNNVLMYEKHDNFWIGLEAYYFSPQLLGDGAEGKSYWIMGLMTEKKFGETVSLFLNFENFLDTRQTAFDTIYTGNLNDPQFRDIYAPVDGFVINGGLKLSF